MKHQGFCIGEGNKAVQLSMSKESSFFQRREGAMMHSRMFAARLWFVLTEESVCAIIIS
jgi:hypothetical protein